MKKTGRGFWALSFMAGLVLFFSAAAYADNPDAVIAYRQKVMQGIVSHMAGIAIILKADLSYTGHIEGHARAMANLAGLLPELFPEGSGKGKTDVLPKAFEDRDDLLKRAKKLETEAMKLAEVAKSGDKGAIAAQRKNVGKACGGCHKNYRQPKKKRYAWKKK